MQVLDRAALILKFSAFGWGMRYPPLYPPAYPPALWQKKEGAVASRPPNRTLEGSVSGNACVAFGDACVEPFLYLPKQPHDPVLAEPNPLGKLPSGFEPRDMLGTIGNATDRP